MTATAKSASSVDELVEIARKMHSRVPGDRTKVICGVSKDEFREICNGLGTSRKKVMMLAFDPKPKYPVRAYAYGASSPLTNLEVFEDQFRQLRLFRNAITAVNRDHEKARRELGKQDEELSRLYSEQQDLRSSLTAEEEAINADRIRRRSKKGDSRQRVAAGRDIEAEIEVVRDQIKARWKVISGSAEFKAAEKRIDAERDLRLNQLYFQFAKCCSYTRKAIMRKGKKMKRFSEWNGDAILVKQAEQFKIRPITDEERHQYRGRIPRGSTHILRMRVGNAKVDAEFAVNVHRPIPEGTTVREITISRRGGEFQRSATKLAERKCRWFIIVTLEDRHGVIKAQRPRHYAAGSVAVDIGWRRTSDGMLKVVTWAGDDGRHGSVVLPRKIEADIVRSFEHQSDSDDQFNAARQEVVRQLPGLWESLPVTCRVAFMPRMRNSTPEDLPSLERAMASVRNLRSHSRLMFALFHLEQAGIEHDLVKYLQLWKEAEGQFRAHTRLAKTAARHRTDFYYRLRNSLLNDYKHVFIEDIDLSALNRRSSVLETDNGMARANIRTASLGKFMEVIREHSLPVNPAHTSRTCHCCGSTTAIRHQEWYTCEHCGESWNRDFNACQNILSRGAVTHQIELRNPEEIGEDRYRETDLSKMSLQVVAGEVF